MSIKSAKLPTLVPNGLEYLDIDETVDLSTAAANFPLVNKIPRGAIPVQAALILSSAIGATTAVKVGLGRITSTADPDKYVLSANLTAQSITNLIVPTTPLAAEETVGIFACATDGTAAGSIGGAGQTARAIITYMVPLLPV